MNAFAREPDRGRDQVGEGELPGAIALFRKRKPRDRTGHADREGGIARFRRISIAVGVEEDVARGRGRRGLAVVDRDVGVVMRKVDHHVAAAADIAGARIGHRHREADRNRGIHRIAALLQHFDADACRAPFLRHDHTVAGGDSGARWQALARPPGRR